MKEKEKETEKRLAMELEREMRESLQYLPHLSEPTYFFKKGECVRYGSLKECVVEDVLDGGKAYVLYCVATDNNYGSPVSYETVHVVPWVNVRPLTFGETDFSRNRIPRPDTWNGTVETILFKYYHEGIDMEPDYQRGYVWEDSDKEFLIDSIFKGIKIGEFLFNRLDFEDAKKRGKETEIIDGKQRLSALVEFYENRLSYHGIYYNNLSPKDCNAFLSTTLVVGELEAASRREILEQFLRLNRTGRVMEDADLKRAEELLEREKRSEATR